MIFHSRASENKIQSYITIAYYKRVYCDVVRLVVFILSHYLVLGREGADYRTASITAKRIILTFDRRPLQVASRYG